MSTRIANYRFEDSLRNLLVIAALHGGSALLFLAPTDAVLLGWGRAQLCGLVALIALWSYYRYDWRSPEGNVGLLVGYVVLLVLELWWFGYPEDIVKKPSSLLTSKGAMLDTFLNLLPHVYVMLRIVCIGIIAWVLNCRPR